MVKTASKTETHIRDSFIKPYKGLHTRSFLCKQLECWLGVFEQCSVLFNTTGCHCQNTP